MPEVTVTGKTVVIRESYPARENWDLPNLLQKVAGDGTPGTMNMQEAPALLARVIESWEFKHDPTDLEAYGDMDMVRELLPLTNKVAGYLNEAMGLGEAE